MSRLRCTVKFLDDVAPAVSEWKAIPVDVERAIAWATEVTKLYEGSVWLERKCPVHGVWESLRVCADCGVLLCTSETCDCEPAEEEPRGGCPDCRMAGSQEHCLGYRDAKGWHE